MGRYLRRAAYNLLLILLSPLLLVWFFLLRKGREEAWQRRRDFFGLSRPVAQPCIWFHAVSVGEVLAAIPLLKALQQHYPEYRLLVTTTTATGRARLQDALGGSVEHRFAPLDLPGAARQFIQRQQPKALILMEREWWLNWLHACRGAGVPVCVVNGRLSPSSFDFYRKLPAFSRDLLNLIDCSLVQEEADKTRLLQLGASPERVEVLGNLKFDLRLESEPEPSTLALAEAIDGRPVWLAASTHEDEEQRLLACHRKLLAEFPDLLLILVPRHPQRFAAVASQIKSSGLSWCQRSQAALPEQTEQVYLADSMGEMLQLLPVADLVFMGGSLVDIGGHNLLEPAALAKPCLIGPYYYNFQQITEQLVACGGARVTSEAQLQGDLSHWLQNREISVAAGLAAKQFVERNQGALQRTLAHLKAVLD